MTTVRELWSGLECRPSKSGEAHVMYGEWTMCGRFWCAGEVSPDATVCERCLNARPTCRVCGCRVPEDYDCHCNYPGWYTGPRDCPGRRLDA